MTLIGPFFGYWLTMGSMYYTFVMEPVKSGSTFTDESGLYHFGAYAGLCLVNSIVSFVTVPNIARYYDFLINGDAIAAE